jgi:hypothetical protein
MSDNISITMPREQWEAVLKCCDIALRVSEQAKEDDMCPNCVTPWKCNGPHLTLEVVQEVCDWVAEEHFNECKEDRPIQNWLRSVPKIWKMYNEK